MIEYVTGKLAEKHPTYVVVEAAGVGYRVHIPISSFTHLGEPGSDVRLLTHHHLREDTEELYGFATSEERTLFLLLIGVSGIGPRLAQAILSGIPSAALRDALAHSDLGALTRIPGVGKKTAERMVVELKEKVMRLVPEGAETPVPGGAAGDDDEAVLALVTLGYNRYEARQAVGRVRTQQSDLALEEIIRAAIRSVR